MVLDFSFKGVKEGVVKFTKVVGWQVASIAVVAVGTQLATYHPTTGQAIGLIMVANAVLAGIGKWLVTVKPQDAPEAAVALG